MIEIYPGMAQDVLGLRRVGVRGIPRARRASHDELDAATCPLVGWLHLRGDTEAMGPGVPVPLVLPRRDAPVLASR